MLRHLGSWNNDLSAGHIVVWQENDLQQVSDLVVAVDSLGNRGDQFDDGLGVVVTWSSLSTNANDSWHESVFSLVGRGVQNGEVSVDNVKDVHKLSLVLVNSLDLNVKHGVDWNIVSSLGFDPGGQSSLVLLLDINELILELLVGGVRHQVSQVVESGDPLINTSESLTDQVRKSWVAAVDPSSWSNTVGLVLELAWVKCVEFAENSIFQELRMKSCDTVDSVRANDSEVSHSDFLWVSFFDQGHSLNFISVSWVLLLKFSQINMVDQVDELQVSWQQFSNEVNGPLLESLWQDGMVGVRESVVNNIPCLFESKALLIEQDSEQLDGSNDWMGVVQLDLVQISESRESIVGVFGFVSSDDIVDRGRAEEVLLL